MSLLRVQNLSKSFGIRELFNDVSFDIDRGDKIGLIGANGAGKTTLLNCIMGLEDYDSGIVKIDVADKIGYVEQQADFSGVTLYDELITAFNDILALADKKNELEETIAGNKADKSDAAMREYVKVSEEFERLGGYEYESSIRRIAFGLGFSEGDLQKAPEDFSGGEKTRISLAKVLLREPDFLFLDEPTNHLDIEMIEWLEEFLRDYKGGILLISHDRFFLDKVTNGIIELLDQKIDIYKGNYTKAMQVRNERRAAQESAFIKQQDYIKKTEEYIRRYKAGIKSKQARGREKQLKRLERIVLPPDAAGFNYFLFNPPVQCAQKVLEIENLAFSFNNADCLFKELSLTIRKGDGAALVGPNGAGKTTLIKLIVGEIEAAVGRIKIGSRVKTGYFSQHHAELNGQNNVLTEITDNYGVDDEQARNYLGAFLFKGDDIYKVVNELSGGEKSRLALLKLMLDGANFIILDEPTNHLDIPAREAVEKALMSFPGTFLVISHDRYFLDKVTNCTYELENGVLTQYEGNYDYYRFKKAENEKDSQEHFSEIPAKKEKIESVGAKHDKPTVKLKRGIVMNEDKRNQEIQRCEAQIAMLEVELKALELQMNDPLIQQEPEKSQSIAEDYAKKEQEIEEKYKEWDNLLV